MMRPAAGWVRGWRWCGGEFGVGFCVVLVCFAAAGVAAGWQRTVFGWLVGGVGGFERWGWRMRGELGGGGDSGRIRLRSVESALGTAVLDAGSLAGGEVVCG